ncbi:MAG: manganese efflux pump [Candidatus Bathyarchaeia archaeon]
MLVIAIGLAMDAFSVSIVYGMTNGGYGKTNTLKMASFFGLFQTVMPVLGWLMGVKIIELIAGFDHWLAFSLLAFIGCKMIYEATIAQHKTRSRRLDLSTLLLLSVATSIDALAVGLSFAFLKVFITIVTAFIGAVAFALSFLGAGMGDKLERFHQTKLES